MGKRRKTVSPATMALTAMRRKWLLWSLLPVLLVLAVIAYLVYFMGWNAFGVSKYKDADFPNSIFGFEHTVHELPIDQWVHPYNIGTTRIAGGAYSKGIEDLVVAESKAPSLDPAGDYSQGERADAPPMCKIRTNHVLGYEFIGKDAFEEADPYWNAYIAAVQGADATGTRERYDELVAEAKRHAADAITHYEEALVAFETALELLAEYACPDFDQLTQDIEEIRDTTKVRLETLKNPEFPPAPPEPEEEEQPQEQPQDNPDDPSDDGQGSGDNEPQDPGNDEEPSDSPDDSEGDDNESQAERDAEAQRRELLEERNKAGQQERENLEGQLGGVGGNGRQW